MSYGFLAVNDDNDVLISSDTKNLHFAGQATHPTSSFSTFTNHGGHHELHYTITFPNRTSIPVPFFRMKAGGYHSIAGIEGVNSGSTSKTWTIKMLMTGSATSTGGSALNIIPDVYVFTDPSAIPVSGNYGFQVFNSDGSVSFDSRLRPLRVTHAGNVLQPANPLSSSNAVTLSGNQCADINNNAFLSNQFNDFAFGNATSDPFPKDGNGNNTPMFHYNALPQTQREISFAVTSSNCTGIGVYGECIGYSTSTTSQSTYWCFYRGGIRFAGVSGGNNIVRAGWIPCQAGCHWLTSSNSLFLALFGPGNSSTSGGAWPYTDETINLTAQSVIVANYSFYD